MHHYVSYTERKSLLFAELNAFLPRKTFISASFIVISCEIRLIYYSNCGYISEKLHNFLTFYRFFAEKKIWSFPTRCCTVKIMCKSYLIYPNLHKLICCKENFNRGKITVLCLRYSNNLMFYIREHVIPPVLL